MYFITLVFVNFSIDKYSIDFCAAKKKLERYFYRPSVWHCIFFPKTHLYFFQPLFKRLSKTIKRRKMSGVYGDPFKSIYATDDHILNPRLASQRPHAVSVQLLKNEVFAKQTEIVVTEAFHCFAGAGALTFYHDVEGTLNCKSLFLFIL